VDEIRVRKTQKTEPIRINQPRKPLSEEFRVRPKKRFSKRFFIYIFIVIIIGVGGFATYQYFLKQGSADVVSDVSKIYLLPEGETPTIATVTDPNKLKSKIFFANAKSGDKVLIYKKADRVILYRPSENKIINVDWLKASDINQSQ